MMEAVDVFGQHDHRLRCDWGPPGAEALAADVTVVVDVLSFTTSVAVAVGRGTAVLPFAWRDDRAAEFAAEHGAVLAVGRLEAARDGLATPTLSPARLLDGPLPPRLVLPSPNGSTISAAHAARGGSVVAGCLRNASAVGHHLLPALRQGRSVAVIAAGERWDDDGSLRVALEDHLGAGAIIAAVLGADPDLEPLLSPEASTAARLFTACRVDLGDLLRGCVGGRELEAKGFAADVEVAAALDVSDVVPVLVDGAFVAAVRARADGAEASA